MAVEFWKCVYFTLRWSLAMRYTPDFKDFNRKKKNNVKTSLEECLHLLHVVGKALWMC